MNSVCPHCGSAIAEGFAYCQKCGRRAIDYVLCEECFEPVAIGASSCPHCTSSVKREKEKAAESLELEVRATHLGAFLGGGNFTGLFLPPIIKVRAGRITVTKWSLLGLRQHSQEIQVSRVASVRYTKGVFWGGILVETFGGASEDLNERGLRQDDAKTMTEQLKGCLRD
jgi:hypothetical protein